MDSIARHPAAPFQKLAPIRIGIRVRLRGLLGLALCAAAVLTLGVLAPQGLRLTLLVTLGLGLVTAAALLPALAVVLLLRLVARRSKPVEERRSESAGLVAL